jgi:hypothetical protein
MRTYPNGAERSMCDMHDRALREALKRPAEFDVRWGLWGHEIIRKLEEERQAISSRLSLMGAEEPPPPRMPETEEEVEVDHLHMRLWEIDIELGDVDPAKPPFVRVRQRQEAA